MENGVMVVGTNPVTGREDEFNEWYATEHVPDMLAVPGFVSARRYVALDDEQDAGEQSEYRYLAIYEIEGPLNDALGALSKAGIKTSPTMEEQTSVAFYSSFPPKSES